MSATAAILKSDLHAVNAGLPEALTAACEAKAYGWLHLTMLEATILYAGAAMFYAEVDGMRLSTASIGTGCADRFLSAHRASPFPELLTEAKALACVEANKRLVLIQDEDGFMFLLRSDLARDVAALRHALHMEGVQTHTLAACAVDDFTPPETVAAFEPARRSLDEKLVEFERVLDDTDTDADAFKS